MPQHSGWEAHRIPNVTMPSRFPANRRFPALTGKRGGEFALPFICQAGTITPCRSGLH